MSKYFPKSRGVSVNIVAIIFFLEKYTATPKSNWTKSAFENMGWDLCRDVQHALLISEMYDTKYSTGEILRKSALKG